MENKKCKSARANSIQVAGINIEWSPQQGTCTFDKLPVAMMWVDSTLAGVMSGVQTMVGTERFLLALQSEGRKSVEADWHVISKFPDFRDGFAAIANIAAVAGWGHWSLTSLDKNQKECRFRVTDSWESRYQKALGVCWGSGMVAGKLAGYCSKLFGANCWADQTAFAARGDVYDEFLVRPSPRSIEREIDNLLATDEAARADMAVALRKLEEEIAERKRAEEALREDEEFIRALLDTSRDWIWAIDLRGVHTYSNPAIKMILGYDSDEVIGVSSFALMHEEDRDRIGAEVTSCIEARRGWSNLVVRWRHKEGGYRFLESNAVPVLDADGNVIGFRGVDRDVTERTLAEAERLEMERRLLHAQKLESLGVLAGGIAHDFNNLLMAVIGNLDLALLDLSPASVARPYIDQAMQATRGGADLTRQMLAYSGKGRFVITRIDLSELVKENTSLFRTAISRTVAMNLALTREGSTIEADAGQVQQVIMNLITNASEAIGEHAGVITLTTGVGAFDDAYLSKSRLSEKPPAGRFAYVEVSDTGCDMDEETQARLFDPFFTTKFTGRGLGMSAVLGIVQGHGGAIVVQTAVGHGSTIRVLFPATEAVGAAVPGDSVGFRPQSEEVARVGTVLVVDDEDVVRGVCAALARRLGLRAFTAADGEEALAFLKTHGDEIGCVLLDLTMPRMDGISAFREMKRLRPDIPVILCSGYDEREAMQRFTSEGLAGFIQKPYRLRDLKNKLEGVQAGRTKTTAEERPKEK